MNNRIPDLLILVPLPSLKSYTDALVEIADGDGNPMDTQYYNPGSEIELACIIRNRSAWSSEIIWMKDEQPLDLYHRPSLR